MTHDDLKAAAKAYFSAHMEHDSASQNLSRAVERHENATDSLRAATHEFNDEIRDKPDQGASAVVKFDGYQLGLVMRHTPDGPSFELVWGALV